MRRLHLMEIEDQPWCPAPVRDGATDYLQFVLERMRPYHAVAPRLARALREGGTDRVLDLGSGAGGPWESLLPGVSAAYGAPVRVTLSDRYPNEEALRRIAERSGGRIGFHPAPVDATDVPPELPGLRTLFSSFHHFAPEEALRILESAVRAGQGIGVFEVTERRAPQLLGMLLVPLFVLLATPAIRPFRWSRVLWTYLLPAVPLVGLVDGVVSCLRTYTPAELQEMTERFAAYRWDVGQVRARRSVPPVTYAIGVPHR